MKSNDVTSFFYFMWNMWSEEICAEVFAEADCGWKHLWSKWNQANVRNGNVFGATEVFFAELDNSNRDLLVQYALTKYDGNRRI